MKNIKIIDYRNGKYQGSIQKSKHSQQVNPHGFGVILDEKYTWVSGTWTNGKLNQSNNASIIFADSDKMFGFLSDPQNSNNNSLIVYESEQYKMYFRNSVLILDIRKCEGSKCNTLSKFKIVNSNINNQIYVTLVLVNHEQYQNGKNSKYLQILRNMLQISKLEEADVQFHQNIKKYHNLHTNINQFTLGNSKLSQPVSLFCDEHKSSLFVQFSKKYHNKISKMGFYDKNSQIEEYCKQLYYYQDGIGGIAQQKINGQVSAFIQYQINYNNNKYMALNDISYYGRPSKQIQQQCSRNLREYYRRSFNFCNKFINLKQVYNMRQFMIGLLGKACKQFQVQQINALKNHCNLSNYLIKSKNVQLNQPQQQMIVQNYEASIADIQKQIAKVQQLGRSKAKYNKQNIYNYKQTTKFHQNYSPGRRNSSGFSFKTHEYSYLNSKQYMNSDYRKYQNIPQSYRNDQDLAIMNNFYPQSSRVNSPKSTPFKVNSPINYTSKNSDEEIAPYRFNQTSYSNVSPIMKVSNFKFQPKSHVRSHRNPHQMEELMRDYMSIQQQIQQYQNGMKNRSKSNKKLNSKKIDQQLYKTRITNENKSQSTSPWTNKLESSDMSQSQKQIKFIDSFAYNIKQNNITECQRTISKSPSKIATTYEKLQKSNKKGNFKHNKR